MKTQNINGTTKRAPSSTDNPSVHGLVSYLSWKAKKRPKNMLGQKEVQVLCIGATFGRNP